MPYTKKVQQYAYTEVEIFDEHGVLLMSTHMSDDTLNDTLSTETLTEAEAEEWL